MARHISWGYLQPWLARRFLLRAWRHALAGCQWWQRVPYGWTLGAGVIIIAIISFVLSACGRPVQIVPNTTTVADLVEIAADVSDNIQRDGTWIEYELWLEDFCKLPAAERSALARQAGRAEPNCAVLRRGRAQ